MGGPWTGPKPSEKERLLDVADVVPRPNLVSVPDADMEEECMGEGEPAVRNGRAPEDPTPQEFERDQATH